MKQYKVTITLFLFMITLISCKWQNNSFIGTWENVAFSDSDIEGEYLIFSDSSTLLIVLNQTLPYIHSDTNIYHFTLAIHNDTTWMIWEDEKDVRTAILLKSDTLCLYSTGRFTGLQMHTYKKVK